MMDLKALAAKLRACSANADEAAWPAEGLELLSEAGCWRNVIPSAFGGDQVAPTRQLETYEAVASGSLSLALILTQHDGACELLAECDNRLLAERILPGCARGEILTTVGISQLTTSRRTGGPAMRAEAVDGGYRVSGLMPWVTSAAKARYIVTGAVLPDDQQILVCAATDSQALSVEPPMQLMGLTSTWTTEVRCEGLFVPSELIMRGPTERALAIRAPAKPLTVSAVGIGPAGAMLEEIRKKAASLPDASQMIEQMEETYQRTRQRLYDAADVLHDPTAEIPSMEIRVAVNDLVVRLAVSLMTLAKGSGYLTLSPVQRLVREAMFFLVWSAPPAVQVGTLQRFWPGDGCS